MFYEDINQNIEVIKPENVISLEKNTNKEQKRRAFAIFLSQSGKD